MKTTYYTLWIAAALALNASADIITQWNFNSAPPDGTSNTGTNVPSTGNGTISVIGGVIQNVSATQEYSTGNNSSDPATTDDSAYHTRAYPLQGEGNKTAGIEVRVSTAGYEGISVTWDQQNSATANKWLRFQYSLDGSTFVDYVVLQMDVQGAYVNGRSVNLSPITGVNHNPNFAFRLVAEFESTATGSGAPAYVQTGTTSYSTNGTMRFDMMTVSGSVPDGNAFPTISSIPDQTIRVDTTTGPLPFTVGDAETPADQLVVSGSSSNPALVSDFGIILGGSGANRTVEVGPNFDQTGTTTITLTVIDGGGKSNFTAFRVTVTPGNTAPTISSITNVHTVADTAFAPISFTIGDAETPASELSVAAFSSDETIIPNGNMTIGGTGANRMLNILPAPGQVGAVVITVTVSDGAFLTSSRSFNAMVVRSSEVIFTEPFNYADGSLITNSAQLWVNRAGTIGQMQAVLGSALVTGSQTEDVTGRLIGNPYGANGSTVLYASFDITFSAPPNGAPDIFAHFSGTNVNELRARVLTTTNGGSFRMGVANTRSGVADVVDYPLDLSLNTTYQVVVCYDVANGTSKLWVDPASGGAWVNAIDPVLPTDISAFGLRQSTRIGDSLIDNILVGTSFEAVTPNLARVYIRRAANNQDLEVYWPASQTWEGFVLQSTTNLATPDWQPVTEPVTPTGEYDVVTITSPTGARFFRLTR